MRVLVACEYSGRVRDAFRERGHEAVSCDLLPTESPGPHIIGDVRTILDWGWDLMIAHPPCTYLSRSGRRWLFEPDDTNPHALKGLPRQAALWDAVHLFQDLQRAPIPRIAIENPRHHDIARAATGPPTQVIHPWEYGHPETKATALWLKGLPPLLVTDVVTGREGRMWRLPPTPDRGHLRSLTYPGIAAAMAEQWGAP